MVAKSDTPQPAAWAMDCRSSRTVISSTAMIWGFMARRTMGMAWAFGQPSSTSVRGPTSIWGWPRYMTATSPRSSTRVIRWGGTPSPPDICRTRSRSKVVLPPPGGDSSKVLRKRPSRNSRGAMSQAMPRCSREIRITAEEICLRFVTAPSFMTAEPHSPTRKPPRTGRKPCRRVSMEAYRENSAAMSHRVSSSSGVTMASSDRSPSGSSTDMHRPARRRNSSALARSFSGSSMAIRRRRLGRMAAARS